ncbi:MAG: HAMP domain-containing protein, partial [Desulfobacteria bacterium]
MLRLSLRTKIMICCIGLVALLDLMVVIFVRSRLVSSFRAEYLAKGRNMAVNLAARSEHFVLTEEFVSLLQLVKDLKDSDEDIAYAYIADRKRDVLAHTFAGGFPADLAGINIPEPDDTWKRELLDTVEEGLIHDIAVPILQGKVGFVHVGISEHRIQRTISHFTLALVAIAGFVLLVAVGLAAVVSWVVTQPVRGLIKAAQKIRDGDLGQQVVATTKDEIGDLVESFNQMSEELLKQHKVLEDRSWRMRTAQEQAAWERDKLRAIIDSMVEGVIFVDDSGRISLCNESAERIWNARA